MSFMSRAWLYIIRKKGKSILLFVILLVMATFVLTALTLGNASKSAQQDLRQSLGGSFLIGFDYTENNPYLKIEDVEGGTLMYSTQQISPELVKQIRGIKGIRECTVIGEYLTGNESQQEKTTAAVYRMENQIYIDNTTYVNLFDNCGFYKVLAYTGQPELLDTLAGSIQEILQEKADITTSDALYQQMKAPLTQITRVVALMRLLTFFTGTMIVSLLLCMWMRSRQKEMAVLISMGEQKHIIFLQALLEATIVFLIALVFACGFGTLTASWLQNLLFSSVETGASLEVSLQLTDVALLLGIGGGVVVIAVLLSLLPVIRANPKDILSRMEG